MEEQKGASVRVDLDAETNEKLERWALKEGRSKREHAAVLLRKLVLLAQESPDELIQIGLMDKLLRGKL